jgi:hypothetical protein
MAERGKLPVSPRRAEKYIRVIEFADFGALFPRLFCPPHRKVVKVH